MQGPVFLMEVLWAHRPSPTGLYFGSLPHASAEPRFSACDTAACSGILLQAENGFRPIRVTIPCAGRPCGPVVLSTSRRHAREGDAAAGEDLGRGSQRSRARSRRAVQVGAFGRVGCADRALLALAAAVAPGAPNSGLRAFAWRSVAQLCDGVSDLRQGRSAVATAGTRPRGIPGLGCGAFACFVGGLGVPLRKVQRPASGHSPGAPRRDSRCRT
jgi:hypothetical protein